MIRQVFSQNILSAYRIKIPGVPLTSYLRIFSSVPEVPSSPQKQSDPILLAARSADSTNDLLKIVSLHGRHMAPNHVAYLLRALCDVQRRDRFGLTQADVLHSKEFHILCSKLKKHVRSLETKELLNALKALSYFKVPFNSALTQKLLYMIKNDINALSIQQIIFLTFLLQQFPSDAVVDALKIALPLVLEAQLKIKLERKNVGTLVDTLKYCATYNLSKDTFDYVVEALCELDQIEWMAMDPRRAANVVSALAEKADNSPQREALFKDAVGVFVKHLSTFDLSDIEHVLHVIVKSYKFAPYLNYQPLFEAAAKVAVRFDWSLRDCSTVLRKLNNVAVPDKNLLNHMANKVLDDPEDFRSIGFGITKTFVHGMAIANYKTEHWIVLKDLIPSCSCFDSIRPTQPWMSFSLDLASLDIFSEKLLSTIFTEEFLQGNMSREYNKIDLIQLGTLWHAVTTLFPNYSGPSPPQRYLNEAYDNMGENVTDFPLEGILAHSLGGKEFVLTRCFALPGFFIDHVLVLDQRGQAVAFPEFQGQDKIVMDDVNIPPDSLRVAIRYIPSGWYNAHKQPKGFALLTQKILENLGYIVVSVTKDQWDETPDWERSPYLMQTIQVKCSQLNKVHETAVE